MKPAGPSFSSSLSLDLIRLSKDQYFDLDKNQQFVLVTPSSAGPGGWKGRLLAAFSGRRASQADSKQAGPLADEDYKRKLLEAAKSYGMRLPAAQHVGFHQALRRIADHDCKDITRARLSATVLNVLTKQARNFSLDLGLQEIEHALARQLAHRRDEIHGKVATLPGYSKETAPVMVSAFMSELRRATLEAIRADRIDNALHNLPAFARANAKRESELARVQDEIAQLEQEIAEKTRQNKAQLAQERPPAHDTGSARERLSALREQEQALQKMDLSAIDHYANPASAKAVVLGLRRHADQALASLLQPGAGWVGAPAGAPDSKQAQQQDRQALDALQQAVSEGGLKDLMPARRLAELQGLLGRPGFVAHHAECEALVRKMLEIGPQPLALVQNAISLRLDQLAAAAPRLALAGEAQESFSLEAFNEARGELRKLLGVGEAEADQLALLYACVADRDLDDAKARALEAFCAAFEPRIGQSNAMAVTGLTAFDYARYLERGLMEFAQAAPVARAAPALTEKKSSPGS